MLVGHASPHVPIYERRHKSSETSGYTTHLQEINAIRTEHLQWQTLIALGFVVICLGVVRTLAIKFSPDEEKKSQERIQNPLSDSDLDKTRQ
jgi:hypothetical protein